MVCLVVQVGFYLAVWVQTIVGSSLLVGRGVVMVLRLCPLEASGSGFLDDLLSLIGYPSGFGGFLLAGTLRMRYCSTHFSNKKPVWGLQPTGGVAALIAGEVSQRESVPVLGRPVLPGREFGDGVRRKRIRLTQKD